MSKIQPEKTTIILFLIALSFISSYQIANAQSLDETAIFSIKLAISPSLIEAGSSDHHIGYLYVLGKNGIPITAAKDISIHLTSDNPQIASVPKEIIFKKGEDYTTFDITTSSLPGETFITASWESITSFQKIQVGIAKSELPDNLILELNIPTENMHVNSAMPFSVYLRTIEGDVIRAPFDIDVDLEYEKSLASVSSDVLTIKKGEYYAWSTLETHEKVGNTFLRAIQSESSLDTAKSIKISSTLPSSLKIDVFPKLLPSEVNRQIDVFVSLVDSDGNPTITPQDIPLKFFSDDQNAVGLNLENTMKDLKPMIKKGQFGYYLRQDLSVFQKVENDIVIGVSAEGYGIASDTFSTVGKTLNVDDKVITENDVQLFVPRQIPSNATAIVTYQINAIETDDDDPEGTNTKNDENKPILTINDLEDGDFYPVIANENYYSDDTSKKLDVISGDKTIITIKNIGKIKSSTSFGTATISSGQKSGPVLISASVQGVGSDSFLTEVVNTLEQKEVRIFSPTGKNSILFDRDGNFDLFLIAIDAQDRPKVMKQDSKYLITPTNGLVEIKKDSTFAFAKLKSDSFKITEQANSIDLKVVPIGENADLFLESITTFITYPSSKIQVILPNDKINANHEQNQGIVQIVDLLGNPIVPSLNVVTKIISSDKTVINSIKDTIIPSGLSYASFSIETTGKIGSSVISASAKGVIGTNQTINTDLAASKLKISTSGLADIIKVNEEVSVKLYVDGEDKESVSGAIVKIQTDDNSSVSPDVIRTNSDGGAIFSLIATNGPTTVNFIAMAEGYEEGQDSIIVNVDVPKKQLTIGSLVIPEWIVYVTIAVVILMITIILLFLKKSKIKTVEEWEEEEI